MLMLLLLVACVVSSQVWEQQFISDLTFTVNFVPRSGKLWYDRHYKGFVVKFDDVNFVDGFEIRCIPDSSQEFSISYDITSPNTCGNITDHIRKDSFMWNPFDYVHYIGFEKLMGHNTVRAFEYRDIIDDIRLVTTVYLDIIEDTIIYITVLAYRHKPAAVLTISVALSNIVPSCPDHAIFSKPHGC